MSATMTVVMSTLLHLVAVVVVVVEGGEGGRGEKAKRKGGMGGIRSNARNQIVVVRNDLVYSTVTSGPIICVSNVP